LVLWRDMAGDFHLQDAYCPHLGAHLAHGGTFRERRAPMPVPRLPASTARVSARTFRTASARIRKGEAAQLPHDRAQRLRARVVSTPTKDAPAWEIPVIEEIGDPA